MIGETWIDLRDIIVQGGGQHDQWHTLNCKGKYAGEIRIETTYYDLRPKPEKPAPKPKPMASNSETELVNGTQKPPIKRRPLPSDPATGKAPSPVTRDDMQTPPRQKPGGPAVYPPKQSAMQPVEYTTPTPPSNRFSRSQTDLHAYAVADGGNQYATPPPRQEYQYPPRSSERSNKYSPSPYEEQQLQPQPQYHPDPRPQYEVGPRRSYHNMHEHYDSPPPPTRHQPPLLEDNGPPPPPPVHRVRNSTGSSQEMVPRGSYDMSQHKSTPPMRHDVLRNEAHRLSISSPSPAYPGRPTYRPYESAPDVQAPAPPPSSDQSMALAPRHHSYDSSYDPHYRSMQPTVEDVPESWTPPKARSSLSSQEQFDEMEYQLIPTTAPLSLNGQRRDVSDHYNSPAPVSVPGQSRRDSNGYAPVPTGHTREYSHPEDLPSHSYPPQNRFIEYPRELENNQVHASDKYAMVPVPATLVPGVDPSRVRESPDYSYEERMRERRYTQPAPVPVQTRGRQHSEPPASSYAAHYSAQAHANQMSNSVNYEQSLVRYGSVPITSPAPPATSRSRGISPNPNANHTIKRKSVSPAPPPPDTRNDGRRLSGVPFGPDSYDELNPALAAAQGPDTNSQDYTNQNGKIVTSDGREVDPSDHLPMDTWAPEPEPKKPSPAPADSRSRPALSGAQPMPPSGRRPLRVTVRPQSAIAAPPQSYGAQEATPSPPVSAGRNRLQKKQHRVSAAPAPMSSGHDPLAPATAHQRNSTPPRALVRASTFDYENYVPQSSYGAPRSGYANGPPIPAKVPMMSGGMGPMESQDRRGSEEWALMEEMSRIDIGTGRARRRLAYHH